MREIKFRAWNNHSKDLVQHPIPNEWICDNGKHNIQVMQFTGLKDKNGVEVYEGDIVSNGSQTFEVKWDKTYARFLMGNDGKWWGMPYFKHYEVVGNIYEAKKEDLLTDGGERKETKCKEMTERDYYGN